VLRDDPTLSGIIFAVRVARRAATEIGWEILHPVAVQAIAALPQDCSANDVSDLAYQAQRAAAESAMPARCASTIHKAKGREFDHVVVPSLDSSTFRESQDDRQLLYVALSRAVKHLTLIVPAADPSPLVRL
jgi:superfamily I DNA/RNA helicase